MSHDQPNEINQRRPFSPEPHIKILRQHRLEQVPRSEVGEKPRITPTQSSQWQQTFFGNGAAAFAKNPHARAARQAEQRRAQLESKLQRKDEVIAGIMAEHLGLKKSLWGKRTVNWVPHDLRDQGVDCGRHWSVRPELPAQRLLGWAGLAPLALRPLAGALRPGQRTQRAGAPRSLAGGLGKALAD